MTRGRGGAVPAARSGALELRPFRAVRYSPDAVGDLGVVTCPPYDVVGVDGVDYWEAAHPRNVVRLVLPRADGGNRYARAVSELDRWLTDGTLVREDRPALWVYEQRLGGATALGLIGAASLHPAEDRVVLPHEDVFPGPVADRAALMAATGAQMEPILLTYEGGGPASDVVDRMASTRPLAEPRTADGGVHLLWRVDDPADLAAIAKDLAARQALIADGHHRYAAYLSLQERDAATGGSSRDGASGAGEAAGRGGRASMRPWSYGLALLVDARRHPLRLGPIHRSVAGLSIEEAVRLAGRGFERVDPLAPGVDPLAVIATRPRAAFAMGDGTGRWFVLTDARPRLVERSLRRDRSMSWRSLDASLAHSLLLEQLWSVDDQDPRVAFHHDPGLAAERAAREAGVALLLNPPPLASVLAVAAGGERMPHKSTSFGPKPRTGLLMRLVDR